MHMRVIRPRPVMRHRRVTLPMVPLRPVVRLPARIKPLTNEVPHLRVLAPRQARVRRRAAPVPLTTGGGVKAVYVGLTGTTDTVISATPADLMSGLQADITNFMVHRLDSGTY